MESVEETGVKEMSPSEGLFLLQFQGQLSCDGKEIEKVEYVPHKIVHRYPRTESEEDQRMSKERFLRELSESEKAFFCHIEKGRSHAFAAMRDPDNSKQWLLLDSLRNGFVQVQEQSMFERHNFAGRASVMIVRDKSESSRVLWSKNKSDYSN